MLEDNRPFSKPRHDVISSTPALHERGMAKMGALTDALAAALKARGVADLRAALAARTGMLYSSRPCSLGSTIPSQVSASVWISPVAS